MIFTPRPQAPIDSSSAPDPRPSRIKPRNLVWFFQIALGLSILTPAHAQNLTCSLTHYRSQSGLSAAVDNDTLNVSWTGDLKNELRLRLAINRGTPTIAELAIRSNGTKWTMLATNVSPEFRVVTGYRRLPQEQITPLLSAGMKLTPQVVEENKWDAFWDAPLSVPGTATGPYIHSILGWMPPKEGVGGLLGMPRTLDEIHRSTAEFQAQGCDVTTSGARLEINFPGVKLGVFAGSLRYTVYKNTNLIRMEVIAKTEEPSVAYKYEAGLDGLAIDPNSQMVWRDVADSWEASGFGGPKNDDEKILQTGNRLVAAEFTGGSITAFPPPHTFFWARELSVNLGYSWYRKDSDKQFSFGVREPESEADPPYAGRGPGDYRECFALKSARPGTWQRMPVYFYISNQSGRDAIESSLKFTRDDHFKALPGYLVMVAHFHPYLVLQLHAFNQGLSATLPDVAALKAAGVNVYAPSDGGLFAWGDAPGQSPHLSAEDAAVQHMKNLALYYEVARLHSGDGFWILPAEELTSGSLAEQLGGHTDLLVSHPVFWGPSRRPGQPLVDNDPKLGTVYHIGSPSDLLEMAHKEDLLVYEPHPRSKASAGYPDAIKDTAYFRDEDYRGFGFRWGMGLDGSEQRLCEYRCLPLLDEANNWTADLPTRPKYLEAISELHMEAPGDDVYANNPVNYVKVDKQPLIDDLRPVIDAMKVGNYFVTSGEVLIPNYSVNGNGDQRTIVADVEWTFPLEFVDVVSGDGKNSDRQTISVTDLPPFGRHHFEIPFNAAGKKWVRFAVWDSAGDGALVQPIKLSDTSSGRESGTK
jgi:hypothetical protein